jgi:GDP-4-dehydro-6-deoxy-D-mannose reductase
VKHALVTGVSGFAGRHLASCLTAAGYDVFGMVRGIRQEPVDGIALERLLVADLEDAASIECAVALAQPRLVFHLAGSTFVPQSHADPTSVYRINVLGTVHLLSAVRAAAPQSRVVVIGSGDAYGRVGAEDIPVTESCPWRPSSPYAASKAAADLIAYQWTQSFGTDVIRLRPFNHTGPRQARSFVCSDFASQLVAIERGLRPPRIAVGDLTAVRDFSDVRDVVSGYLLAGEKATSGEAYNLCSGVGRSIREVLDELIEISGVQVEVTVDPAKLRPAEVPRLIGSCAKFQAATGWRPAIPWRQTLTDLLNDWRARSDAQLS